MARDDEDEEENAFEKADESELKLAAIEPPNAVLAPPAAAAAEPELLALALGALAAVPRPKLLRNQEEGERELDADAATRDFASTAAAPLDENAPISFLSFVSSDACNANDTHRDDELLRNSEMQFEYSMGNRYDYK